MSHALDSNDRKVWTSPAPTPFDRARYAAVTFDCLYAERERDPRMTSLGARLGIIDRPARFTRLEPFVRHVRRRGRAGIATRKAIADHRAARNPHVEP